MSGCATELWEGNPAWLQPGFCANVVADGLFKPRGLHIDRSTDEILLVERGNSRVLRLDDDGASKVPVAMMGGLNHGIELAGGYLYASTPTTVYRWPYQTGQTTAASADDMQEVIVGMDRDASNELGAPGGHTTRTLAFDAEGEWLYVSIGSLGNVDVDSFRSRIRRFNIVDWDAAQPLNFIDGEVFADGLRNEVGLAFDVHGDLWGVENGADRLTRDDLGGVIVNDNPAEELNRFKEEQAGQHWGYPYCWSEYCLPVEVGGSGMKGANTRWAWPSFMGVGYTDEWCRENTNESVMSMPAHSAPLGITFYKWKDMSQEEYDSSGCTGGLPKSMDGYAFIAFHGSWNRSPPTGYKVVYIPFDDEGNPTALPIDLLRHNGDTAKWPDPIRPVDVQFDSCGRLYVTEDGTGNVLKITYSGSGGYLDEFVPIETDVADGASCYPYQPPSVSTSESPPTLPPTLPPSTDVPSKSPFVSTSNIPSTSDTSSNPSTHLSSDAPSNTPSEMSTASSSHLPSNTPSSSYTSSVPSNIPSEMPTTPSTTLPSELKRSPSSSPSKAPTNPTKSPTPPSNLFVDETTGTSIGNLPTSESLQPPTGDSLQPDNTCCPEPISGSTPTGRIRLFTALAFSIPLLHW